MLARQAVAPESTQGSSGSDSKASEESVRGKYGEDAWVLIVNLAPLS